MCIALDLRQGRLAEYSAGHRYGISFEEIGHRLYCPPLNPIGRSLAAVPAPTEMLKDNRQSKTKSGQFSNPRLEHTRCTFFEISGFLSQGL